MKADGSFRLDQSYFDYATGLAMTNGRFADLFGGSPRDPESLLTQRDMDLAASVQLVIEEIVGRLTTTAAREAGLRQLCLAGGVALNCVANGNLLRSGAFRRHLDPAGRGRCRRGARRRAGCLARTPWG